MKHEASWSGNARDVSRPKAKKRRPMGTSDTTLQTLWRAVVRAQWGGKCAFSDGECRGDLECHHIIKRARPHLKHVPANGILLCQAHHSMVEQFPSWRQKVSEAVGEDTMEWLEDRARKHLPDFLIEQGQTRSEWLASTKAYLKALL